MNLKVTRALVISPHTDDGELGAGGTIAKLLAGGCEVYYLALSICEKSVPQGLDREILEREVHNALDVLGIPATNRFIYKFENRVFPQLRYQIFETLEKVRTRIAPELVLVPDLNDTHQDHSTTTAEAIRAFRREYASIIAYELPWNNLSFRTSCFVRLGKEYLDKKINALKCYVSQQDKRYFQAEFIKAIAEARATQINAEYAEAFDVIKLVW